MSEYTTEYTGSSPSKLASENNRNAITIVFMLWGWKLALMSNVRAHRPPSPDLSKFQSSKAPVPSANGGSVQRSGSAIQGSSLKNLRPTPTNGSWGWPIRALGNVPTEQSKHTKGNQCESAKINSRKSTEGNEGNKDAAPFVHSVTFC